MKNEYNKSKVIIDYNLIPQFIEYPAKVLNNMIHVGLLFNNSFLVDSDARSISKKVTNKIILELINRN